MPGTYRSPLNFKRDDLVIVDRNEDYYPAIVVGPDTNQRFGYVYVCPLDESGEVGVEPEFVWPAIWTFHGPIQK